MSGQNGYGQFNERGVTIMAVFNFFKKLVKRKGGKGPVEVVREDRSRVDAAAFHTPPSEPYQQFDADLDLSQQTDLEGYARELSVSKESIERWISSGLLMPDEMKVAEKLVKFMNKQ
jgi:hypothetical protein